METQELVFEVTMPRGAWFSLGFGQEMANTDMIGWACHSKKKPEVLDLYSYAYPGWSAPQVDKIQNLTTTVTKEANNRITYVTRRKMDT